MENSVTNEECQLQLERRRQIEKLWAVEEKLVSVLQGVRDELRELQLNEPAKETVPANSEPESATNLSFVESGRSAVGCSQCQGAGQCADCGDIV